MACFGIGICRGRRKLFSLIEAVMREKQSCNYTVHCRSEQWETVVSLALVCMSSSLNHNQSQTNQNSYSKTLVS